MPLPANFNLMRLFRGEYPEASITLHLHTNDLVLPVQAELASFQEPTFRGYQPVDVPLPARYKLDLKTFVWGNPTARFAARDLEEDVPIAGAFFVLHWEGEGLLMSFAPFFPRPILKAPSSTIQVNATGLYTKVSDQFAMNN